jgi:hypothetical protein
MFKSVLNSIGNAAFVCAWIFCIAKIFRMEHLWGGRSEHELSVVIWSWAIVAAVSKLYVINIAPQIRKMVIEPKRSNVSDLDSES